MDGMNLTESLFRWIHVVSGILWIGLLYFFNFVNGPFAATMDADTKKKVVPELMPRALHFFRMGALFTWVTGFLLLGMVYYPRGFVFEGGQKSWGTGGPVVLFAFLAFVIYDPLMKAIAKPEVQAAVGLVGATGAVFLFSKVGPFTYRGTAIHLGAMFGTLMFMNVFMRIVPNQRRIIAAVKNGEKPDPAWVAMAGTRSKHNTYMSVPLVFTMLGQHATWAASYAFALPVLVLLAWLAVYGLYQSAAKPKVL
jgi:uncharacterized membrane protein